jgi:hypothetical protein
MIVVQKALLQADLRCSKQELIFLNNALNEVCNGLDFDDGEFHTRLGTTKVEGRTLLAQIGNALDAMR